LRLWASRIVLTVLACVAGYLLWSLIYAVLVGARFDPKLPGEGTARWALLQSLNHGAFSDILTRSADHLGRRLLYLPTQAETAVRGALALGLTLALGAGLAIAAWVTRPSTLHGAARWGTLLDAERRKLTKTRGLVLGKLGGATIASDEPGHVLVVGPTRSGKGQSFIVPNGVMWEGSMIVFDPKRENFSLFGAWREARGNAVFLFHPGEARSHRYNPLDFVRTGDAMPTDALVVAGFIVPETPGEVWGKSAKLLLAALIGYVLTSSLCEGRRHLRSVAKLLVSGREIADVLKAILKTESPQLPSWVIDAFNQYVALEPETRNSALFNLNLSLNPWNNLLVAAATETSDFDIRAFRRRRMSLFIGSSVAQLEAFRPLINILIQQIHDVLMAAPPARDEPHQVLLIIDEFRQLGRMEELVSKLAINAGYGVRVALILQNLAQLDEVYGRAARETTVSACALQLYIRIDDLDTSEYLARMLGERTVQVRRASFRPTDGLLGRRTITLDHAGQPLRSAQELRQMDPGQAILLASSAPPFALRRIVYHNDQPYRRAVEGVQFRSVAVPELSPYKEAPPTPVGMTPKATTQKRQDGQMPLPLSARASAAVKPPWERVAEAGLRSGEVVRAQQDDQASALAAVQDAPSANAPVNEAANALSNLDGAFGDDERRD